MGANTRIEWAHHTFNPWIGCTKVSAACDHCYAERDMDKRFGRVTWGAGEKRQLTSEANWRKPFAWDRQAAKAGTRPRVFCASLADVFDAEVPDAWRDRLFALIALTPNLDWLLLTKRPQVALKYLSADELGGRLAYAVSGMQGGGDPGDCPPWPLPNVWLGCTVETQAMAEARIPTLLRCPAAKRFLSCEPLLGPVDLNGVCLVPKKPGSRRAGVHLDALRGRYCESGQPYHGEWDISDSPPPADTPPRRLDWIIAGGESGPKARPSHPDWFRALRDQCSATGVPFFFKQWGEWLPYHHFGDAGVEDEPEATRYRTMEWTGDGFEDVGRPIWCDFIDGHVDDEQCVGRVGKKAAGRTLDGRTHDEMPA